MHFTTPLYAVLWLCCAVCGACLIDRWIALPEDAQDEAAAATGFIPVDAADAISQQEEALYGETETERDTAEGVGQRGRAEEGSAEQQTKRGLQSWQHQDEIKSRWKEQGMLLWAINQAGSAQLTCTTSDYRL